jgi:hypothetical protein
MANKKIVIKQAYSAFNRRDIDGALALMTEGVSWPKASEGGRVADDARVCQSVLRRHLFADQAN